MELELIREYFPKGTNGELYCDGKLVCYCIELPWKNNERKVSCIPEGRYELIKWYSRKFEWHLFVLYVKGRESILIHPANNALKELKGCIAPVLKLTGPGLGLDSRKACEKIYALTFSAFKQKEKVYVTIKSKNNDNLKKGNGSYA